MAHDRIWATNLVLQMWAEIDISYPKWNNVIALQRELTLKKRGLALFHLSPS